MTSRALSEAGLAEKHQEPRWFPGSSHPQASCEPDGQELGLLKVGDFSRTLLSPSLSLSPVSGGVIMCGHVLDPRSLGLPVPRPCRPAPSSRPRRGCAAHVRSVLPLFPALAPAFLHQALNIIRSVLRNCSSAARSGT